MPTAACPAVWNPVCGCDDQTYSNTCYAHASGVNVSYVGVCLASAPPVADAGEDQVVTVGDTVTLDGSGSTDPEDDALSYSWSITSRPFGSVAILSDASMINPGFVPDREGSYIISLIVNDGTSDSAADSVTITVEPGPPRSCSNSADCLAGEYCEKTEGSCGVTGSCTLMLTACPAVWAPVCGCDDQTYGNACEAAASSVNVSYTGECL